jgi:hypothetical protein
MRLRTLSSATSTSDVSADAVLPKNVNEVPVSYSVLPETIKPFSLRIRTTAATLARVPTLAELN